MARREGNDYFEMMKDMVACACRAAEKLEAVLGAFDVDTLNADMTALHEIEHEGDNLKHQLVEKLVKEFITPIEREDIMEITSQIDDVTDAVEDVLLKIYMFNIKQIPEKALEFSRVISRCCEELLAVFSAFADFKKSKTIHVSIVEINRLEEQGDALYMEGMRALYSGDADPMTVIGWTEVYACLEKCCDTCEHTADMVEHVIMKNT